MSWLTCGICKHSEEASSLDTPTSQKIIDYHELSQNRKFRITIITKCEENSESVGNSELEEGEEEEEHLKNQECSSKSVNFFVDLSELVAVCTHFQKYEKLEYLELSTNCSSTWVSGPKDVALSSQDCRHNYTSNLNPQYFHAFLESACPSIYGIRPAPITMESIIPVLDMLSHFHSEPLLTNCERVLMSTNLNQLNGNILIQLLDKGLSVSLDHRILARILCVCLMSTASKMADFSQDLVGNVGSVFAQAFVANVSKSFRHIKPLEQENSMWPLAVRHLMQPHTSSNDRASDRSEDGAGKKNKNRKSKRQGCDHTEESFECILCFDQKCGKCRGEAAFCYKALDNFLYEVRLQLYPHTYRQHLDRDSLREDRINDYILRHQLQPFP